MACGQEVIVVADHTKFGRLALARLCGLEEVARLVVDRGPGRRVSRRSLEARGRPRPLAPVDEATARRSANGTAAPTPA